MVSGCEERGVTERKSKKGHVGRAGKPELKLGLGQLVGAACGGH
jgi:hypothetical protein